MKTETAPETGVGTLPSIAERLVTRVNYLARPRRERWHLPELEIERGRSIRYTLAFILLAGALAIQDVKLQSGDFPASTPQITFSTRFGDSYRFSDYGFGRVNRGECKNGQQEVRVELFDPPIIGELTNRPRFPVLPDGTISKNPIYGYLPRLEQPCLS